MPVSPQGANAVGDFLKAAPILGTLTVVILWGAPVLLRLLPRNRVEAAFSSPPLMRTWNLVMLVALIVMIAWWATQTDFIAKMKAYLNESSNSGPA